MSDAPRRLTALHIAPTPFFADRGCHVRIRGLVTALQRRGVGCLLCTYHHGRDVDAVETVRIPRIPGYRKVAAGPSPFKYVADLLLLWVVVREAWRRQPDVLHGHLHEGALLAWLTSKALFWRRLPVVFDMQGSLTGELEEYGYFARVPGLRRLFAWIERRIDALPDAIVASSARSLAIARDRFGVPRQRLHLVEDGVDVEPADPASVDELLRKWQLHGARPIVVYTGSLLRVKGLEVLQETLREAARRRLDARFLLVGYPVDEMRAYVDRHGLESNCTLTGRVPFESIGSVLAMAEVALEPKRGASGEASGKLLNYMAAGLPVVCFDTDTNREILGSCGCYASSPSVDAFVDRLETLLGSSEARALGECGRKRVAERFSWDRSAERLHSLYALLLGDGDG